MIVFVCLGVIQVFFSVLFLATKRPCQLSDKVLAVWLVLLGFPMGLLLIHLMSGGHTLTGWLASLLFGVIPFSVSFLHGPFLLFYTRAVIGKKMFSRKTVWLHFLLFLGAGIFLLISNAFSRPLPPNLTDTPVPINTILSLMNVGALTGYSLYVLFLIKEHRKDVFNYFSYETIKISLKWLQCIVACFISTLLLALSIGEGHHILAPVMTRMGVPKDVWERIPSFLHQLNFVFLIYTLSFFGFRQSIIFPAAENKPDETTKKIRSPGQTEKTGNKYERSGLSPDLAENYLQRVEQYMKDEKPYLDSNLTIDKVAKSLGIKRYYLTQVINGELKKNFYTYINEFRFYDAKNRILDPENTDRTLLDISLASGFNSYPVFNSVFKKYTNMTPSKFRMAHKK